MNYLGGKSHVVGRFAHVLTEMAAPGVTYWEPFLGGGSVAAAVVPSFTRAVPSDSMPDLIDMWKALVAGWSPPETLSEQEYAALRHAGPSPLRTFAGFSLSHAGKWWNGYARPHRKQVDRVGAPRRACLKKASVFAGASISCLDYSAITPAPGDVVYCDPPYAGTTRYGAVADFDHERFWRQAHQWASSGVHVYVSEFSAPTEWAAVWSRPHMNHMRRETPRTEHIFSLATT